MNTLQHYRLTARTHGRWAGLAAAVLPDLCQAVGRWGPTRRIRRWGRNLHNTPQSVVRMEAVHPLLGAAWSAHREQDRVSHRFAYSWVSDAGDLPPTTVLLLSGGLDSFIAWRLLGHPKAIYFAIGHRAEGEELERIRRIRSRFIPGNLVGGPGSIQVDHSLRIGYTELSNGYIPFRNLLFLFRAAEYSDHVALAQILEWAPDKNRAFYRQVERLARRCTTGRFQGLVAKRVRVHTPYAGFTKTALIRRYLQAGFPAEDLTTLTYSCYANTPLPCGTCTACFSRYVAMENNGIHEPYRQTPSGAGFRQHLHWRDLRPQRAYMYLRRYLEMEPYL